MEIHLKLKHNYISYTFSTVPQRNQKYKNHRTPWGPSVSRAQLEVSIDHTSTLHNRSTLLLASEKYFLIVTSGWLFHSKRNGAAYGETKKCYSLPWNSVFVSIGKEWSVTKLQVCKRICTDYQRREERDSGTIYYPTSLPTFWVEITLRCSGTIFRHALQLDLVTKL